jgi:hypothetical protein
MAESIHPFYDSRLARIEPDDRLVVLARTIQARDPGTEAELKDSAVNWARFGETCLGQALYRHRSVFRNASEAAVWSHLELSYFRDIVPADAIHELVVKQQPAETQLLRAEILLTTPSAFILPRNWQGSADRPERQASLEYIEVQSPYLGEYRDIMRKYIGPAAAKLVQANRIGTFRTMETAAVLYRDPSAEDQLEPDSSMRSECRRLQWVRPGVRCRAPRGFAGRRLCGRLRRPRPHAHDPPLDLQRSRGGGGRCGRAGRHSGTMRGIRPGSFAWRLCLIPHPNRPQTQHRALVTVNGGRNLGQRGGAKAGH